MAERNLKHAYYFTQSIEPNSDCHDEFDESDVWGYPVEPGPVLPKPIPAVGSNRKKNGRSDRVAVSISMPVNIPDWSKILKHEYRGNTNGYDESDEEGGDVTAGVVPPHEYLGRNRAVSFSVHEGVGRTLKGRDLSRLRNAIFEKMGFQD